ncbi:MAG: M20/M25/M40 family metallo-hydrolase [Anaerolineae bacterium]|nr:M20/M25/M40 family metallo-hydrolase [Anaerolineae bacterium]
MDALIKKLAECWGPPGFEHQIRDLIRAEVEDIADDITVDALGNLICRIGNGEKRIMTAAHMDEIGLIVGYIDRQGYARFASIGGLFPATLLGARVRFENGVIGTIGVEHQFTKRRDLPDLSGFYIDFSESTNDAGGNENAAVRVGDPAGFVGEVIRRGDRVIGKSLDDRGGCAIQIAAMRRVKEQGTPHSVYFVFTVQEEVGVRGAAPAAFGIEPDLMLAIDCTPTGDVPNCKPMAVTLGGGAAIKTRDTGLIVPPAVRDLLIQRAEAAGIPYQLEVLELGSTDARAVQNVLTGVPAGAISYPVRYVHTRSETADINDMQAVVDLLVAVVTQEIVL